MSSSPPVTLDGGAADDPLLAALAAEAAEAAGDVVAAARLAVRHAPTFPMPGVHTVRLWSALATLACVDLTVARLVEPHLDALAILDQAGDRWGVEPGPGGWGVFAAEGPGTPLRAEEEGEGWVLTGRKNWCSVAHALDRALVTAWVGTERRMFAVDLHHPGVEPVRWLWHARGLPLVESGPVDFAAAPATPVGEVGWYLDRPGFAWGGMGVAAVWYGGAVGVARRVFGGLTGAQRGPDQVALMHLGRCDTALHGARAVLAEAGRQVDQGLLTGEAAAVAALRVRDTVATAVESVLTTASHALGPGPLALEAEHSGRVADLALYVRQWHAERDQAALGAAVSGSTDLPW